MTEQPRTAAEAKGRLLLLADLVEALPAGWRPGNFHMAGDNTSSWPLSLIDWACWLWAPEASLRARAAAQALGLGARFEPSSLLSPIGEAKWWAGPEDQGYISPLMAALACRRVAWNGAPNWHAHARRAGELNVDAPRDPASPEDREIARLELVAEGISDKHPTMGAAIAAVLRWSIADRQGWGGCRVMSCDPANSTILHVEGMGMETTVLALLAGGGRASPTPDTAVDGLARVWADGRIECKLHSDMPIQGRA